MTVEKKQNMTLAIVALVVGLFIGFLAASNIKAPPDALNDLGKLGREIKERDLVVAITSDKNGKIEVFKPGGEEVLSCSDKRRTKSCRAEFAKGPKGEFILVERQSGKPLRLSHKTIEIKVAGYVGSHCPFIGGNGLFWDPCH